MKLLLLAVTLVATAHLARAQTQLTSQRLMELRSAVQQSQLRSAAAPGAVIAPQLSAEERALLRRQVQEQSAKSRS